ncbi:very-short-patch-repair endonuclease [Ralstonia sp. 151470066-2]|jgi:very-short-patch-repair endonuclease|uniref:DUF559 domain-containing protein n=4 Tax=Pseudomonadota TaxID=1224 RepID=A0AAD2BTF0_9RALS|nr:MULTISPECIES: DUF559 domain-containing protein [Ralstonia]MBA9871422.1 DUF559 domain-containing protein [Ralstonia insidiosa]NOZ17966.1 DUF559 domain-containing protein [Betaproteobacteria bacterium]CAJ0804174.1 hypothetical protein R77560_04030 [Ralstonia sp. LMG 18095]MBA9915676.1 DUF559 domain-containing protein [Ralstonia insidiosa]MBA9954667.1 DUF559 domain-containing protein [Ralstonia insidiosa]
MNIPVSAVRDLLRQSGRTLRLPASAAIRLGLDVPKQPRRAGSDPFDPQSRLADALRARLGNEAVQTEVSGLIAGRRYRADIVIASANLVIEFDGFQYHRSKQAFQKDRERQNAFVANGWRVLRFFHAQVRNDLEGVVAQVLSICGRSAAEPAIASGSAA